MPVIKQIYCSGSLYTFLEFIQDLARPPPPIASAEFNHLFDMHFYIKGTHLYQFSHTSTCSVNPGCISFMFFLILRQIDLKIYRRFYNNASRLFVQHCTLPQPESCCAILSESSLVNHIDILFLNYYFASF